jgi:short subunit fatty acids transporter
MGNNEDVIFIKKLLQRKPDERLRNFILDSLFKEFIPLSETAFSQESYISMDTIIIGLINKKKCKMR